MQNTSTLAWLIGNQGTPNEFRFELSKSETTLGRESDCDIQLKDPLVSRRHAQICFREGGFEIEDLNSSNGTFVNNQLVSSGPVGDGDRIQIGNTILKFRMAPDPDATIIQNRPAQETIAAAKKTVPHQQDAITCSECEGSNPSGGRFCFQCGARLPQLLPSFQETLETFRNILSAYRVGHLNTEQYHAALADLMVQDDQGEYWMLGVESGEWYWHDGEDWQLRNPPHYLPKDQEAPKAESPADQELQQPEAVSPKRTNRNRWGAVGLWLFGALIVLVTGIFVVRELISFSRDASASLLAPLSSAVEEPLDSLDLSADESNQTTSDTTSSSSPTGTGMDYHIRPYDPVSDASLLSFTAEAELLEDQSTDNYTFYTSQFDFGSPGILVMGWCAIDHTTLDENMAVIQLEGALDGSPIPEEIWTQKNSQEQDMVCRHYRAVVENLTPGSHVFVWSTSYDVPVFDGWETFQPGTYFKEVNIRIAEGYQFSDDFLNSLGHWGELESEEARIWIEEGELRIELNQPSISAISHFQDRQFTDFTLVATARSLTDSSGMYGVVFRFQDNQNYYSFQLLEQGIYRLVKQAGETIELIPWTESDAIAGHGAGNTLTVSMTGDHIQAFINDQLAADYQDATFTSGKLSLIAGTPQDVDSYQAGFQQVTIEAPE
jgi:pSer/pThr/pTyr-binding forkhead associated (FHA) protein